MRKAVAILALVFTFSIVLSVEWYSVRAGEDHGQQIIDNYLDRSNHGAEKVRFHLATKLTTGNWNDVQRAIILRAFNDRRSISEAEVADAFSREDAVAVFYNIGSVDIEDLRHVYAMPFGKSQLVREWAPERRHKLWQMNAALTLVRYPDLNADQQQYVIEFAQAIPTITRENAPQWDQRAVDLKFPRQVGRTLLTTIGDGRCPGQFASIGKPKIAGNCVCTTSAGNWSCTDSCQGAGTCSIVAGDCGILWLYDCNAMCTLGNGEMQ
jgi:hypothetical protein